MPKDKWLVFAERKVRLVVAVEADDENEARLKALEADASAVSGDQAKLEDVQLGKWQFHEGIDALALMNEAGFQARDCIEDDDITDVMEEDHLHPERWRPGGERAPGGARYRPPTDDDDEVVSPEVSS